MYCTPKVLGLNITLSQIFVLYSTKKARYIININRLHCFRTVVEIQCCESQQSLKLRILDYDCFLRFLKCR